MRAHVRSLVALTLAGTTLLGASTAAAQTKFSCTDAEAILLARKLVRAHYNETTAGGPFRLGGAAEPQRAPEFWMSYGILQSMTSDTKTTTTRTSNLAHAVFVGPYDYQVEWTKSGNSAATLTICNYVIKASKDKARYMTENMYVFLSQASATAPTGTATRTLPLTTRNLTNPAYDIKDMLRVSIIIVSPHSYVNELKSTLTVRKVDPGQRPP